MIRKFSYTKIGGEAWMMSLLCKILDGFGLNSDLEMEKVIKLLYLYIFTLSCRFICKQEFS